MALSTSQFHFYPFIGKPTPSALDWHIGEAETGAKTETALNVVRRVRAAASTWAAMATDANCRCLPAL
jgi:hypothetical protein